MPTTWATNMQSSPMRVPWPMAIRLLNLVPVPMTVPVSSAAAAKGPSARRRAARVIGVAPGRIMWKHVLPNVLGPVLVGVAGALTGSPRLAILAILLLAVLDLVHRGVITSPAVRSPNSKISWSRRPDGCAGVGKTPVRPVCDHGETTRARIAVKPVVEYQPASLDFADPASLAVRGARVRVGLFQLRQCRLRFFHAEPGGIGETGQRCGDVPMSVRQREKRHP